MQPTMAYALVVAVVLGWMAVSSPLPVAARDTHWWHPLFGGGDAAGGNPKELAASDDISSHGSGDADSTSSSFLGATTPSNIGDDSSTGNGDTGDSSGDDDGNGGSTSDGSNSSGSSDSTIIVRRNASGSDDDDGDGDATNDKEFGSDINGPVTAPSAADVAQDSTADHTVVYDATNAEPVPEDPSLVNDWDANDESCPRFNLTHLPRVCSVLRRVCVFQETLITHDWRYSYANPRRESLPEMPWVENWNFPAAVGTNTDALKGRGNRYRLRLRPASAYEPTEALRNPVFTNRTLPFIIVADFPFNMGEFFAKVVSAVDLLAMDGRATLVLQTPMGLGLAAFHSLLLMSYSRFPVITSSELGDPGCTDARVSASARAGRRSSSGRAVPWSSEAVRPHCFQRMIMCKWDLQTGGGTPLALVASRVVAAFVREDLLPQSPVRFPASSGSGGARGSETDPDPRGTTTLRVLIETRQGPVRNIKNMEDLLAACKELDRTGFTAGTFRRIYCATTSFSEADGSVDRSQFLANVAAVRSAHVLVVLHGAGATNSWFMRQGSSALVELRPCGFGTHFGPWPDKYMPKQHEKNDDVIRFFALNVEDQEQCFKGDIEASLRNRTAKRDNVGWDAGYFARDQHLALKPEPFLEFVRHVGELLLDVNAYRDARDADQLHGYIVPEGLMYGKLGIMKLQEFREAENPPVIPFP